MNAEREQGQSGHSDGGNEPSSQAAQPSVTVENASGESIPVRRDTDVTQVAGARLSPEDAADASSSAETPREHGAPAPTVSPETRASSASESDADAAARDNEVTGPRPTPSDDDFVRAEGDDDDDEDELFEGEDRPEGEEDATPEDAHAEEGAEEGSAGEDEDEDPDSDSDSDSDSDDVYAEDEEDIDDPEGDLSENAGGESLDSDEDSDETVVGGRALGLPPRDESRSEAPLRSRRHHVAPALITLDRVDEDSTFKLRPEEDVSPLATDLARLGQLFPVDLRLKPPDRFQVVCGFRRVAALRFLQRDKVLARLHTDLTDEDALLMSLADAIHAVPIQREELETLRGRLEEEGRLGSEARDMLDKALTEGDALAPETVDEEVDADELAAKVALQLGDINQDLALLADVFASLDANMKQTLLQQLRYSAQLVEFLEGKG